MDIKDPVCNGAIREVAKMIDEKKYSIRDFRNFLRFFEMVVSLREGISNESIFVDGLVKGKKLMLNRLVDRLHEIDSLVRLIESP